MNRLSFIGALFGWFIGDALYSVLVNHYYFHIANILIAVMGMMLLWEESDKKSETKTVERKRNPYKPLGDL